MVALAKDVELADVPRLLPVVGADMQRYGGVAGKPEAIEEDGALLWYAKRAVQERVQVHASLRNGSNALVLFRGLEGKPVNHRQVVSSIEQAVIERGCTLQNAVRMLQESLVSAVEYTTAQQTSRLAYPAPIGGSYSDAMLQGMNEEQEAENAVYSPFSDMPFIEAHHRDEFDKFVFGDQPELAFRRVVDFDEDGQPVYGEAGYCRAGDIIGMVVYEDLFRFASRVIAFRLAGSDRASTGLLGVVTSGFSEGFSSFSTDAQPSCSQARSRAANSWSATEDPLLRGGAVSAMCEGTVSVRLSRAGVVTSWEFEARSYQQDGRFEFPSSPWWPERCVGGRLIGFPLSTTGYDNDPTVDLTVMYVYGLERYQVKSLSAISGGVVASGSSIEINMPSFIGDITKAFPLDTLSLLCFAPSGSVFKVNESNLLAWPVVVFEFTDAQAEPDE